ncbi:MAG: hypothetical protein FJ280_31000 [Planctomycetes bacterium]|nr:hypothetical protein [Planctomycetota bacterium]
MRSTQHVAQAQKQLEDAKTFGNANDIRRAEEAMHAAVGANRVAVGKRTARLADLDAQRKRLVEQARQADVDGDSRAKATCEKAIKIIDGKIRNLPPV